MGNRLTKEWLPKLPDVYGEDGEQGERGESNAELWWKAKGYYVYNVSESKFFQDIGIDLVIGYTANDIAFGVDAKNNLKKDDRVCVERDSLFKSSNQAEYWHHTNDSDPSDHIIYRVSDMKKYLINNNVKTYFTHKYEEVYYVGRMITRIMEYKHGRQNIQI